MSAGWNPISGHDGPGVGGTRPPFSPYGAPMPSQNEPYTFHAGGPGYTPAGMMPPHMPWASMTYGFYHVGGGPVVGDMYPAQPVYAGPPPPYTQPNGAGNAFTREQQPWPRVDPAMPAAQMTNSTGGVGCEPGYNYFFPAEHTKVHVFRSARPPWQLPANTHIVFNATHVPSNTTFEKLMQGFGCTNPSAKKNRVFELVSGGGGKWYKGLEVNGGDKEMMKTTIAEVGWDSSRTGLAGEKPVVCLWFCKD